jgi:hypothetical protein
MDSAGADRALGCAADNAGADIALVHAAKNEHEAVVQVLLEWNDVGPEFSDALRYATEGKHETIVQLLRKIEIMG